MGLDTSHDVRSRAQRSRGVPLMAYGDSDRREELILAIVAIGMVFALLAIGIRLAL